MALKFISLAKLLPTSGDGGVSGDDGCKANGHAGFVYPIAPVLHSPQHHGGGDHGEFKITGGDDRGHHSCGFQATDPTDPTNPTDLKGPALPIYFYNADEPVNTHSVIEVCDEQETVEGCAEGSSVINAGKLHAWLDDVSVAFQAQQIAIPAFETRAQPVDRMAWRAAAQTYHAHHFNCDICIAAGRGLQYGQRCLPGLLLWEAYDKHPSNKFESTMPVHPIQHP